MTGTSAKIAYSFLLMALAIFVAMPPRHAPVQIAEVAVAPPSTESRLAKAIHERISVEVTGAIPAARLNQLAAEENGLRQLAFADDARGAREQLIDYLADELSAALLQRSEIAAKQDDGERVKMDAVVRALTAAINAEVRGVTA